MSKFGLALMLTTIAGLSTGVGSILSFLLPKKDYKSLSFGLGFAAGVMIFVSLVEIFFEALGLLSTKYGNLSSLVFCSISFFVGILLAGFIDKKMSNVPLKFGSKKSNLKRTGVILFITIVIHNLPEGIISFLSAAEVPKIALPVIIAIAIHNIPEGIAVSLPVYYSTGSKIKAIGLSFLSGLAEPLGGLIGYLLLKPILTNMTMGLMLSAVAGLMVYISFAELLPLSQEYGESETASIGLISGMIIMGLSICFFK